MVHSYKMYVWLKLWFDFFLVKNHVMICLVKIMVGIDVIHKKTKKHIN